MNIVRLLLGTAAPALLLALVAVHFATRPARPDRLERRRARSQRAYARDVALGPAQLIAELAQVPAFDDDSDDAVPVDMPALMVGQDFEDAMDWVRDVEAHLAAEFALIELTGVGAR